MTKNYIAEIWITSNEVPTSLLELITKQNIRVSFWKMRYEVDTEDTSILKFETQNTKKMQKIINMAEKEYADTLYQAVVYLVEIEETTTKLKHIVWKNYTPTA